MSRVELDDGDFVKFQDEFYNLLEKYGVSKITNDHKHFNDICELRNKVIEFIEEEKFFNKNPQYTRGHNND
mgnify:CR=1 FL=1|jgi:hypothetical protein|tara:strand:+ start:1170 stop:1382 length:213 start_codon:yes stop_codon:yes gene_type:complete